MPPRLARRILASLAPPTLREELLDELAEGYRARRRRSGARAANRWYWRQAASLDWLRLRRELAVRRRARPHRSEEPMHSLLKDGIQALRALRRRPGFTLVVVVTLALGIGANVALMSVVGAVLLRPLPYGDPDDVVAVWSRWAGFPKTWVSIEEYRSYRDDLTSFESVALYSAGTGNLTDGDVPELVGLAAVTVNLFDVLGVSPARGRAFLEEEAVPMNGDAVVLTHRLWERRYGGDPRRVGGRIELDGKPRTVVGVLPEGFRLPIDFDAETRTEVFLPLAVPPGTVPLPRMGGSHSYFVVARLAEGATVETARSEMRAWNERARRSGVYPEEMQFETLVLPISEDILGSVRPALLVLLGAVGFVLVIACTNVANVVLSRGQERRREIALRTALGAGSGRLFRQLMTESLVLALLGGAVGVVLARWALSLLIALEPGGIPRLGEARLDGPILLFAVVLTLLTALLFGTLPALSSSRVSLRSALGEGSRGSGSGRGSERFRAVLVVAQLALAVVLVAGAGLMIRTFATLIRIDPGFRAENVLSLRLSLPAESYPETPGILAFFDRLLEDVRALPGVERAAAIRVLPLATPIGDWGTRIEGYVPPSGMNAGADWQVASEDYFETMGIPLLEGRTFTAADRADGEPVAVVNEAFVTRFWPGEDAVVGKRILMGGADEPPWVRVVGVVSNVRHNGITAEMKPGWYRPLRQFHQSSGFTPRAMTLVVEGSVRPESLAGPVRSVVRALDPKLPLAEVRSLEAVLASAVAASRFTMTLLVLFSTLALALAVVGVYGVISYLVSQKRAEIGLRMALGASPASVLRMVVLRGLVLSATGIVLGGAAALGVTRFMDSVLYGVGPRDPVTFGLVPLVLLAAALAGCFVPALSAARVDPVAALRAE